MSAKERDKEGIDEIPSGKKKEQQLNVKDKKRKKRAKQRRKQGLKQIAQVSTREKIQDKEKARCKRNENEREREKKDRQD